MSASREHFLTLIHKAYSVHFDSLPLTDSSLAAAYAFHSADESFVLSRKVKLWRAETHEFVFVFSLPHLDAAVWERCRAKALELGMSRIHPHSEHRTSYITALVVCDEGTQEAMTAIRKTRYHKNFLFSLHGWMDFRAAAVVLASGNIVVNRAARDMEDFLRGNLEKC